MAEKRGLFGWGWAGVEFVNAHFQWIGPIASGIWAARQAAMTAELDKYAPLSYFLAFLVAAVLAALVISFMGLLVERLGRRKYYDAISEQPPSVNPLAATFTGLRIYPSGLADPITRVIRGKTFVGCELMGVRQAYVFSSCVISNPKLFESTLITAPLEDGQGRNGYFGFIFINCTFNHCSFFNHVMVFSRQTAEGLIATGVAPNRDNWFMPPPA